MFEIQENFNLKKYNTFNIDIKCRYFARLGCTNEIPILIDAIHAKPDLKYTKKVILGGGSNLLFTKDFEGLVIYPNIKGIEILDSSNGQYLVKVSSGTVWDDFVRFCTENEMYGAENLSGIPGNVGATPVQNIGAYGVEAKDIIEEVDTVDMASGEMVKFQNKDCQFGYRTSIFKTKFKNQLLISSVTFRLNKTPDYCLEYGNLEKELTGKKLSPEVVRNTILSIRDKKLPNPEIQGNAGSFFKNPVVGTKKYQEIKNKYPNIVAYPLESGTKIKLAAGWMIDNLGWKGKKIGGAGVHQNQALVLINCGNAKGNEILKLANEIKSSVYAEYDVELESEVIVL